LPSVSLAQKVSGAAGGTVGLIVELGDYFSQQEFDAVAARWLAGRMADVVGAEALADKVGLGVGSVVHLAPAGDVTFDALGGDLLMITEAKHLVDDGIYSVRFKACAEGAPPVLDPADSSSEPDSVVVSATVTSDRDPNNLGRVKVKLAPFGDSELAEEIWARCVSPAAGDGHGLLDLPEPGDEVMVLLDPRTLTHPVVLGAAYNGKQKALVDKIPSHASVDKNKLQGNNLKYYLTKAGTCIIHDTGSGGPRLIVATPNVSLVLAEGSDGGFDIQVRDGGTTKCQVQGKKDGSLTLKGKNISIEADQSLVLKAGGSAKISAGTTMDLKSSGNMTVKTDQNYEMQATMKATEKASLGFEVQGGVNMKLQAAIIQIN